MQINNIRMKGYVTIIKNKINLQLHNIVTIAQKQPHLREILSQLQDLKSHWAM